VIRRVPLAFMMDGAPVAAMAAELAARAAGASAPIQYATDATVTLNFAGGADDIPTFSLSDLRACVAKNDKEFFRRQFDGKVVIVGTLLDVEDRKITSKRLATAVEGARAERCALPMPAPGQKFTRDSISGVYIHATAVNNLMRGDALIEFDRIFTGLISFALALFAAAAALALGPVSAALAYLGIAAAWTTGATVAFRSALALPLIEPLVAALAALVITIGFRFVIADRGRRLLRQSFALYLAPAVIEKMVASKRPPVLGGEMREVTVYFSDIEDFTSFAEKTSPAELVTAMNEYLTAMTDIIEAHGGFVDKYIGDAIVAVFGAPVDDPDHAANAVRAALQCNARLPELSLLAAAFQGRSVRQRIGLNTGEALVGNIGSHRRFNYTVMGDMVNLASRLESANKFFGTGIIASETTKAAAGDAIVWREIDAIQVKGREGAVRIYEPLAVKGEATPEQEQRAKAYAGALAQFRARDFAAAAAHFGRIGDPPSLMFAQRAKELAKSPPTAGWEPINALEEK
jgi:adenylate cyclase